MLLKSRDTLLRRCSTALLELRSTMLLQRCLTPLQKLFLYRYCNVLRIVATFQELQALYLQRSSKMFTQRFLKMLLESCSQTLLQCCSTMLL